MRRVMVALILTAAALAQITHDTSAAKQQVLWQKLEASITDVDRNFDGVMGLAIEDLNSGQKYLLRGDDVFPQASSIKIAVLAELYRQAQQDKLKLTDVYTVKASDLVADSPIMNGLTPGVTQVTLRDLATMVVAVSDNSAANILIDRVGIDHLTRRVMRDFQPGIVRHQGKTVVERAVALVDSPDRQHAQQERIATKRLHPADDLAGDERSSSL